MWAIRFATEILMQDGGCDRAVADANREIFVYPFLQTPFRQRHTLTIGDNV